MPQLFGNQYTKQQLLELVGDMTQLASARRAELVEGNERGSDLIEVFNASGLCFSILPGRSLDVASLPTTKGCHSAFGAVPAMWGPPSTNPKAMAGCAAFLAGW